MQTDAAPAAPPTRPQRRGPRAALAPAAGLLAFAALVWTVREFVTDDAFISLRYARNLARGFGPVWNPGGPVVEGYSNPLLVLVEALAFRLGLPAVGVARGLGVVSGLGLVVLCWVAGRRVVGARGAAAAAVMVGAAPALAYWSVGGLETLPFALLLTAAGLELARDDKGSALRGGLLLAVLPWLRPEGLALAAALVFFSEIRGLLDAPQRLATLRRLLWLAGLPLASQVGLQALRLAWFDHHLPNSVIYKGATGQFGIVTLRFLGENAPVVILGVAALFVLRGRSRLLAAPALVYLAASVTFLDSVNTFSRLLLPTLPLWALLSGAALAGDRDAEPSPRRRRALVGGTIAVVVLVGGILPAGAPWVTDKAHEYFTCRDVVRRQAGAWLRERLGPGDTYAIADAGLVPFTADGTAIDIFALNDPRLQVTGPTKPVVRAARTLDERPRFIVFASRTVDRLTAAYPVERAIVRDDRFGPGYRRAEGFGSAACTDVYNLIVFQRTDTAAPPA